MVGVQQNARKQRLPLPVQALPSSRAARCLLIAKAVARLTFKACEMLNVAAKSVDPGQKSKFPIGVACCLAGRLYALGCASQR